MALIFKQNRESYRAIISGGWHRGRWAAGLLALLILLVSHRAAFAYSTTDVNNFVSAYNAQFYTTSGTNAFIKNTQSGGVTYFWGQAEEIECYIDAYEWTSNKVYLGMMTNLLNGFINVNGTVWTGDDYNDDNFWAIMAFMRAGRDSGMTNYCKLAKTDFDAIYARAWSTNLGGGLFWLYPDNASKNACVNGPGAIAAYLVYQYTGDTNYLNKAQNIYAWERSVLFNTNNGAIYDNIGTNSVISTWASTYNQGTFLGAANFLGLTNDAALAAKFTMVNLTTEGVLPQYGIAGNNSGFNAIFLRWMNRFMRDRNLQSAYEPWLQLNAAAAWNSRRASDNLAWCQWPLPTPLGTNFYSWDCISSFEAMFAATPPQTNAPVLMPTDYIGYWPLNAAAGLTAADLSGNGNAGLITNATWAPNGSINSCLAFNGNSSVQIANTVSNDFTISFRVQTTQTASSGEWYSGAGLVDGDYPGPANDFGTSLIGGKFALGIGNPDTTLLSKLLINDGNWHHCVATRVRSTGVTSLYVDGALQSVGSANKNTLNASAHLVFGAIASGGGGFIGNLAEIKIWGRALSSNEVASLYASTLALPSAPTGLTAVGSSGQVQLNWFESSAVNSYTVARSLVNGGPYTVLTNVTTTAFTDTNVVNNRTYYYVVAGVNAVGTGTNSAQVSAVPLAPTAWLRADTLTGLASGAPVSAWPDVTGNGWTAWQNVTNNQPTYVTNAINGYPVVRFNATNSSYLWFYPPVSNDFTIIIVFRSSQNNQGSGTAFWNGAGLLNADQSGTQNDFGMQLNSNGQVVAGTGNPDIAIATGSGYNNGRPHVVTFRRWRSTGALSIFVDGTQLASGVGSTNTLNAPPALYLGAVPSGAGFFNGDMAEVQIYNSPLASTDRLDLENSLKCKYGLTGAELPAPSSITTSPGNRQVTLNWTLTTGASGYNIWRSVADTSNFQLVASDVPGSSYEDTNAVVGQVNFYEIASVDGCGAGPNSFAAGVIVPQPAVGISVSGQSLSLTWPGWANDWTLYSATNLTPPVVWLPVTNSAASNNNAFNLSLPLNAQTEFFLLSAP